MMQGDYVKTRNRKQFRDLSSPFILLAVTWSGACRSQLQSEWKIIEASKDISAAGLSPPSPSTAGLHNVRWLSCLLLCHLQVCFHNASRTGAQILVLLSEKNDIWEREFNSCRWLCCQMRCKMETEASLWGFTGSDGLPKSSHTFRAECVILREMQEETAFVLNVISPCVHGTQNLQFYLC